MWFCNRNNEEKDVCRTVADNVYFRTVDKYNACMGQPLEPKYFRLLIEYACDCTSQTDLSVL